MAESNSWWDFVNQYVTNQASSPTIYSVDANGQRFPSINPQTSPYLTPLIRSGQDPRVPGNWIEPAQAYAAQSGAIEPSPGDVPARSPLGSRFEFPGYESAPNLENQRWDQFRINQGKNISKEEPKQTKAEQKQSLLAQVMAPFIEGAQHTASTVMGDLQDKGVFGTATNAIIQSLAGARGIGMPVVPAQTSLVAPLGGELFQRTIPAVNPLSSVINSYSHTPVGMVANAAAQLPQLEYINRKGDDVTQAIIRALNR